jgi:hypothetical protein
MRRFILPLSLLLRRNVTDRRDVEDKRSDVAHEDERKHVKRTDTSAKD